MSGFGLRSIEQERLAAATRSAHSPDQALEREFCRALGDEFLPVLYHLQHPQERQHIALRPAKKRWVRASAFLFSSSVDT